MSDLAAREEAAAGTPAERAASAQVPVTERVIAALPGPRLFWTVLWAGWTLATLIILRSLAPAQLPVFFDPDETTTTFGGVVGYSMFIFLFGIRKLGRDVAALLPSVEQLTEGRMRQGEPFRAMGSIWWPVMINLVLLVPFEIPRFLNAGSALSLFSAAVGFVGWFPLATFAWMAGAVLWGLHHLGGSSLALVSFEADRSLGLRPFGALAFVPVLIYTAAAFPLILITGVLDIRDAVIILGLLIGLLALSFASLRRLRRQLLEAKGRTLRWARGLYGDALDPVRDGGIAELRAGAPELMAAESVERRAAAIQEWPFDEGIFRVIVAMVTSVVTAILARLILSQLNL